MAHVSEGMIRPPKKLSVEALSGPILITLLRGSVLFVVGPNGVGKSALLQTLYRQLSSTEAIYLPGYRTIVLNNGTDNLLYAIDTLDMEMFKRPEEFNRYKNFWGDDQFKSLIKRFLNAENLHTDELLEEVRNDPEHAKAITSKKDSPIEILNSVFAFANMAVSFKRTTNGLTAVRNGTEYSIEKLSDGERASLFLCCAILSRAKSKIQVVIIDEPEKHLHPSISSPVISALVRSRPDIYLVFGTHDTSLFESIQYHDYVYIRESIIIENEPEKRRYDLQVFSETEEFPEDLKRDVLGIRNKVLFIEGSTSSLDRALYSNFFPEWKIVPRGGHEKIIETVKVLAENKNLLGFARKE